MFKIAFIDKEPRADWLAARIYSNLCYDGNMEIIFYKPDEYEQFVSGKFDLIFLNAEIDNMDKIADKISNESENTELALFATEKEPEAGYFKWHLLGYFMKCNIWEDILTKSLECIKFGDRKNHRTMIACDGRGYVVDMYDILYLQRRKHGSSVLVCGFDNDTNRYEWLDCRQTLEEWYEELKEMNFEYIGKSFIVNISRIIRMDKKRNLFFLYGDILHVTEKYKEMFCSRYNEYIRRKYMPEKEENT